MPEVGPILERLNRARAGLEAAARALPAEKWRQPPRPGAWSAAEVIAHLIMVEERITGGATKLIAGPPPRVPIWKRLHAPPILAKWRAFRARTPIPLDSSLVSEREEMLAKLAAIRQRTLAVLELNRNRDLRAYRWRHPFLGSLNLYDWFRMVAYHELRHTEQIREIVELSTDR